MAPVCALQAPADAQQAAPQTNPGVIGRENQKSIERLPDLQDIPPLTGPLVTGPGQPARPKIQPGGPTFVLKKVVFSRSALLSQRDVEATASPFLGKRVDLSQLYDIVDAVNALYTKKGIPNALAVLPPEHIEDGVVHINLVEGRLNKVLLAGKPYTPKDFILKRIRLTPGEVLNVPKLSNQIAVFNRTNDVQVRAALQPGDQFGQTDLAVTVVEPPRNTLDVIADNWGISSTGDWEGALLYRRHGLVMADDSMMLYGIGNAGDLSGSFSYDAPVDDFGGRLGASYNYTHTHVLHGPYKALSITGHSQSATTQFTQPIFANARWLVTGVANYSYIQTLSNQGSAPQTNDTSNKEGAGLQLSYIGARSVADLGFNYAHGQARNAVLSTDIDYNIASGTYHVQRVLPYSLSLNVQGAWQQTSAKELPSDQLFSLGGPNSVRGYDSNLVAGFTGAYGQFEVHRDESKVIKGLDVFGFVDAGRVSSPATSSKTLVGIGVGSSYAFSRRFDAQLSIGAPVKDVAPNQSSVAVYLRLVAHVL